MIRFLVVVILSWSTLASAFDWEGHRGARGLYPENTIGAMEEALKYPVTTLELDVVISKDMKVVVSHEPWMNEEICLDPNGQRIKGKEHNLFKMTYNEIVKYDCGSLPYPRFPEQKKVIVGKPLLIQLIDSSELQLKKLNRTHVRYNIEIKSTPEDEKLGFQPDYKSFTDLVLKTIQGKLKNDRFIIQSFDWRILKYLHEKYPDVSLSVLQEEYMKPQVILKTLGFVPQYYSPYYKNLNQADINEFHQKKIGIVPWTVNTVKEMEELQRMKVDGIITDYPNLISLVGVKKCNESQHLFEGKCVNLPKHAVPSDRNPGWICDRGYIQKRFSCIKIKVPTHAILLEDGKTWQCKSGYKRYRDKCKSE